MVIKTGEENERDQGEGAKPGEVEPGAGEPEEVKKVPVFLGDIPPKGKKNFCKWAMMHGKNEEELEEEGFNPGTVRISAYELEKSGHRKRAKEKPSGEGKGTALQAGPKKELQVFAKGSPPEALVESMALPISDGEGPTFEKGMKFGASVVVLGVRIAQELSMIGVQQARPLVEMARDMRAGEAMAAKSAAAEAAMLTAAQVQQNLAPYLANISAASQGPDPMKGMMARVMEPILGRLMGTVIPGAQPEAPSGWSKRQE